MVSHDRMPARKVRDPRFDGVSGGLDPTLFAKEYGFVNESRGREMKELSAALKVATEQADREKLVERIRLLREHERIINQKKDTHALNVRVKAKRRQLNEEAGRPVRLKKSKLKEIEAEERFEMLKETGDLDKYLNKKRKKMQQRNKKTIPVSQKPAK